MSKVSMRFELTAVFFSAKSNIAKMNNREDIPKQAFVAKLNKGKKYHASGIISWPSSGRTSRCLFPFHCR
jgi:hypothetical protein